MSTPKKQSSERSALLGGSPKEQYDSASVEMADLDAECAASGPLAITATKRRERTAIRLAVVFCLVFMVVELVGGYIAHSLAILTDAAHLLTDIGAFALSLFSIQVALRGSDHVYSYGYHRAEVVGTLASVFTIWALVGGIVVEAVGRLQTMYMCAHEDIHDLRKRRVDCTPVDSFTMCCLGVLGLAVNLGCAAILSWGGSHGHSHAGLGHGHAHAGGDDHGHSHGGGDHEDHGHAHGGGDDHGHGHGDHDDHGHAHGCDHGDDHGHAHAAGADRHDDHGHADHGKSGKSKSVALNAAFLHALGDSIQSVGVILAGLFIYYMNLRDFGKPTVNHSVYNLADPVCSLLFGVITLYTTKALVGQLLGILMESTPSHIDYRKLRKSLLEIKGVVKLHDLHIWSIGADHAALTVHLVVDREDRYGAVLEQSQNVCKRHGVGHATIQVESREFGDGQCETAVGCHNC